MAAAEKLLASIRRITIAVDQPESTPAEEFAERMLNEAEAIATGGTEAPHSLIEKAQNVTQAFQHLEEAIAKEGEVPLEIVLEMTAHEAPMSTLYKEFDSAWHQFTLHFLNDRVATAKR